MPLTYGIDVHGTLACRDKSRRLHRSNLAQLLVPLMKALRRQRAKVYIVSGPPKKAVEDELRSLGIESHTHFDGIVSVVDFLKSRGFEMEERPVGSGNWWTTEPVWNAAKGWICDAYDIDIMIDNQPEYKRAMPGRTEFVLVHAELLEEDDDG